MVPVVENDSLVEIAYTLKDAFGEVLESTEAGPSFTYVHGQQQLLAGLEHALVGMSVGDEKDVTLPPDQAYGAVDPTAFMEVGKYRLPPEALVAGTTLTARRSSGETMFVSVEEVRDDDTVVINLNHPLAGKTLCFHLRVLSIVPQPR